MTPNGFLVGLAFGSLAFNIAIGLILGWDPFNIFGAVAGAVASVVAVCLIAVERRQS